MRSKDLFKLSTRMFKARTSRTLLTILGMGVGISAILFLVSFGYGLQNVLLEKITTSDALLALDATPSKETETPVIIDDAFIEETKKINNVTEISPISQVTAQVHFDELTSNISTEIIKPSFFALDGVEVDYGTILNDDVENGIIVSSSFAKIFKQEPKEIVQKKVELELLIPKEKKGESATEPETETVYFDAPFTVIGMLEQEEPIIYINIKDVQKKTVIPYYTRMKVKANSTDNIEDIRTELSAKGLAISSLSDTVEQANKVFRVIQIILALFGVIALIVSAIGMFNTMTVTLLERTEEIGIMKSIGVSDSDILMMFVFESSIMGFFGGLAGVLIGIMEGKIFNFGLNFLAGRFGGEPVQLFYSPLWFIGLILVLGSVVGFMTGLVPAKRAGSIDPLDALRYK